MDLQQSKLTKAEWNSIEIPVSVEELNVLNLIRNGANNVNIVLNKTPSFISKIKITPSNDIQGHLFKRYFKDQILHICSKYKYSDLIYKEPNLKTII